MKLFKLILFTLLLLPSFVFGVEVGDRAENSPKIDTNSKENLKTEKNSNIKFDLKATLYGGGMFNYTSYNVNSPVAGARLMLNFDWDITKKIYLDTFYSAEFEKGFTGAQSTTMTLDHFKNYAKTGLGYKTETLDILAAMKWFWMYRPQWPDLYQPNPLCSVSPGANNCGIPDPTKEGYLATDRNTFHKLAPTIEMKYSGIKNLNLSIEGSFLRNIEVNDPHYDPAIATHLVPSTFTGGSGKLTAEYKPLKWLGIELSEEFEYRKYDNALARDAITGKTHYTATPNPQYEEGHNTISLKPVFYISSIHMKIKPFFNYDENLDLFQGYYSYTGFEPGLEVWNRIGNFEYTIGASYNMITYGPNSYDPAKTTDGKALYKNYLKASVELGYKINSHFEIFANGDLLMKTTNYPSYVPGVSPASKNYSIDFNFNNYYIISGVVYRM